MKTLKKLIAGLFSVVLCASLFATPAFAITGDYVFDEKGVLSQSQFDTLEQMGKEYASQYEMGVYLLINDDMGSSNPSPSERNEFAKNYFLQHDLGVGSYKNGIIFVISVTSRDYVTVKHIGNNYDPFSNNGVDALEETVTSYLSKSDWYGGSKAYYDTVGEQLAYYDATGKQWTEPDPIGLLLKILATIGIPAGVAATIVRGDKNAMKTAREASEASNYLDQGSLKLSMSTDNFINTTMTVAPIPKQQSSGGSGWSNMGGGFSGSGGGKF